MMSCNMNMIMQGDQYPIYIKIKENKEDLDIDIVDRIQFTLGDMVKMYIKTPGEQEVSEVTYDALNKDFIFPMTQKESIKFESGLDCQVRIKYSDGTIKGKRVGVIKLEYSLTGEEI